MKSNLKKAAILRAAIKCIARYGVESASADAISKEMGIAQSGIFYHYPTQEKLFDSLDGYIAQVNHDTVVKYISKNRATSVWDRLMAHLNGNLLWAKKHPDHVSVLLVSMAKTGRNRAMRVRINRLFQVGEDRIKSLLVEGLENNEFTYEGDSNKLAAFIHKSLTGLIISYYYSRQRRDIRFFQEILEENLRRILFPTMSQKKIGTHGPRSVVLVNRGNRAKANAKENFSRSLRSET